MWAVLASAAAAVAVAGAVAVVAAFGGGGSEAGWLKPNADDANTRVASSSTIDASNVSNLRIAWTQPLTGSGTFGFFASTPLIDESGITYVQDLASNVFAYDLETGEKLWEATYDQPSVGPNGLAYEDGSVYGVTARDVFALDAATGKESWRQTILTEGPHVNPTEGQTVGLAIQPAVRDGVLYLAEAARPGGGNLLALDAADGSEIWRFDTTKEPKGDRAPSGGAWSTPALDGEGNVFFGVGNGYYTPNAPKRFQNERLYTDSALKLTAATGKLDWYYQALPNDFYDWDLHVSPVLAEQGGRNLVVVSGKLGIVYALDRDSGELVWKTPVGKHNGHDNDSRAQLEGALDLELPFELYPGSLGGVLTNLALSDGVVYAAVLNVPSPVTPADLDRTVLPADLAKGSGAIVALELATGEIRWQRELAQLPFGAITISNDLLFTTTFDGTVRAYAIGDGAELWTGDLGAGTNSPLAIAGDTLVTAAGFPQGPGQKAQLVVFKLNASG
jgi:outer membrane protein assembly factor BamB